MLGDTSWVGFGHGALALAAIWWAWVCFAWLTGTSDEAGPLTRTLIFLAMAAMLVAAIALPDAFGDHPLTFGLAYLCVRLLHVVLFVRLSRRDAELRTAVGRLIPTLLTGPAFVVVAAFADSPYRELLWLVGGLIDFGGPIICGMYGWKVLPSYFVERHGSIIIIALGESIVQVGAGAGGDATQPSLLVGSSGWCSAC